MKIQVTRWKQKQKTEFCWWAHTFRNNARASTRHTNERQDEPNQNSENSSGSILKPFSSKIKWKGLVFYVLKQLWSLKRKFMKLEVSFPEVYVSVILGSHSLTLQVPPPVGFQTLNGFEEALLVLNQCSLLLTNYYYY